MFQYSIGRDLAFATKSELKIDISEFRNYPLRSYQLSDFNIQACIATEEDIRKVKKKYLKWFNKKIVREKNFKFDAGILKLSGDLLLEGYWQSYKYFDGISEIIKKDFSLKNAMSESYNLIAEEIYNTDSVSIHIRRGDYVQNKKTNRYHGVCSPQYYIDAANYIEKKVSTPFFYVFSDDPSWVETDFKIPFKYKLVAGIKNQTCQQDLMLMSYCKHNIIANSTFSWWAAWLNSNSSKIVIAPQKWFGNNMIETTDLIYDDWIRI